MIEPHILGIPGLTPGGLGALGTFGLVLIALIKTWPALVKLGIDARAALRAEARDASSDCQRRLDAMEARLDSAEARAHTLEMKVTLWGAAYRMVVTELHRKDGKNAVLASAQAMLTPDMVPDLPFMDPAQGPE